MDGQYDRLVVDTLVVRRLQLAPGVFIQVTGDNDISIVSALNDPAKIKFLFPRGAGAGAISFCQLADGWENDPSLPHVELVLLQGKRLEALRAFNRPDLTAGEFTAHLKRPDLENDPAMERVIFWASSWNPANGDTLPPPHVEPPPPPPPTLPADMLARSWQIFEAMAAEFGVDIDRDSEGMPDPERAVHKALEDWRYRNSADPLLDVINLEYREKYRQRGQP